MKPSHPILIWTLLFSVVMIFLSPGVGDDSQVYHLPGMINILRSGSLINFDPGQLYRAAAITNYYPRGFEAMGALFHLLPLTTPLMIAFKLGLFYTFYHLLRRHGGDQQIALALIALLISMQFVRDDLGNLKNDLVMAIPLVWAAAVTFSQDRQKNEWWLVPACCAVAMAMKSSALLYSAPVLLLWLWKFREQKGRCFLAIVGIIIPIGLFFYVANWLVLGNPVYPFQMRLGGWVLFPGQENNLFQTTILANLDRDFLPLFLRGLLRMAGPGGVIALLSAGVLGAGRWALGARKGLKPKAYILTPNTSILPPNAFFLLFLWLLIFTLTPFSDNNGVVHNQIYSGNTIRMALPTILLLVWMIVHPLAVWVEGRERRKQRLLMAMGCMACVNLFWYDALSLVIKPENAFAWVAPVARSFNNGVLVGWVLGIGMACGVAIALKRRWIWGGLIIAAITLQQAGYPESLGYTMRFKQIGTPSTVFSYLKEQKIGREDVIAIHSADESSFFLAVINDYLLPRADRVVYMDELNASDAPTPPHPQTPIRPFGATAPEWLVLCAKDTFELDGSVRGRHYRASWDFLTMDSAMDGYKQVYVDLYYMIWEARP